MKKPFFSFFQQQKPGAFLLYNEMYNLKVEKYIYFCNYALVVSDCYLFFIYNI